VGANGPDVRNCDPNVRRTRNSSSTFCAELSHDRPRSGALVKAVLMFPDNPVAIIVWLSSRVRVWSGVTAMGVLSGIAKASFS
jgi:hypothetical protein